MNEKARYYFDLTAGDPDGDDGFESSDLEEVKARAQEVADKMNKTVYIYVAWPDTYDRFEGKVYLSERGITECYTDVTPSKKEV